MYRTLVMSILFMNFVHAKIIIMRHGEATQNIELFYNSNPNHPNYCPTYLTQKGIAQVKKSACKLRDLGLNRDNTIAYVSPLPRTKQTAEILAAEGVISKDIMYVDDRLIEVQMGDLEGKQYADFPQYYWNHSNALEYNGETEEQVAMRVECILREALARYPNDDKDIIFITHGTPAFQLIKICTSNHVILQPAEFKMIDPIQK